MPSLKIPKLPRRRSGAPSLKDRATALKVATVRAMRRRAAETVPAGVGADPQLSAMVAELLEARHKLNDPAVPDGPEADAIGERETALSMAVHRFPARSIHDMAAKLPFLREEADDAGRKWDRSRGVPFKDSVPGAAWEGLLRDIGRLAKAEVGAAAEIAPDPILMAIEASKAAQAAMDRWSEKWGEGRLSETDLAEEARLNRLQYEAHDTVLLTVPTTAVGRLALLDYLRWQMGLYGMANGEPPDAGSSFWREAYKALKAALAFDGPAFQSASASNLSGCSIRQLARLYETLTARWHIASVTMNAPFVWDGDNYSAVGRILDNECDRLAKMMEDIVREIKSRKASDEEGDDRLVVLVRQDIESNGCVADRALLAEISRAWGA